MHKTLAILAAAVVTAAASFGEIKPAHRIGNPDWWLPRFTAKRIEIANCGGTFDLVFVGDSITHYWEVYGKEQLDTLRKTYSVLDIGYSGDRIEHLLWRLENGELAGYKAKCFMLMIGTNNAGDARTPVADVAAGIRRSLDLIAESQPQAVTLLLPVFPRGDAQDARRKWNEELNGVIRGFADGKKVVWVDFNSKFLDADGDTKWIMPDRLHPNADGYGKVWLPSVLPYFKEICGK